MKFGNISEAYEHLKKQKSGFSENTKQEGEFGEIDPVIFKFFFDLQVKLEKEGAAASKGMDYHLYATRMWTTLVGPVDENSQPFFMEFENSLIAGLHGIDMEPNVYEHVAENLVELIRKYQAMVKNTAIWSTGDVEATAYQVGKIKSSEIVKTYHQALKEVLSSEEVGKLIKEKTSYLVADEKFQAMAEYVEKVMDEHPGEGAKLVIVEDSRTNFTKVKNALVEKLGSRFEQVELIPIWVTYSREGQGAEKQATSPDLKENLAKEKIELNAVGSFHELLDTERFGDIFNGAHLFVDFDGVIGNNIKMREEQAKVTYDSLMRSALEFTGKTKDELIESLKNKI